MTGLALSLRNDMISRFANRGDIVVATCTSFRCAGKYATLVTRVTCNLCVRPCKREAGREVIKLLLR
jgi:hypothetical protein